MKKITLLIGAVFVTTVSFSQVIVKLTSVPCNTGLEGTYPWGSTDWDETTPTWSSHPNMFDGNNAVSGPLELINDGQLGDAQTYLLGLGAPFPNPPLNSAIPASAVGCDTTNAATQDMTGKIAVMYRGGCNFSLKAYNAQKRGAAAVIIINHTGDPIPMGAGALGASITIPTFMVSRVVGDDLFLALNSCAPGTVEGFIGSKVGVNNDDLGSSVADVVMPNELSIPSNIAVDGTNYPIDLGIWAFNYGVNAQTGVTATVSIEHEINGVVYTNTSTPIDFIAPNLTTFVVDTQYFALGTYAPASWVQGLYTITYTLNLPGDEDFSDNTFDVDFRVTSSAFAKGRTTAGNEPIASTAYSLNETTTTYDDFEVCIVFRSPVVATSTPGGGILTGLTFSAAPVGTLMEGQILEIRAYEWNNTFTDITAWDNLTTLAQITSTYFSQLNQVASNFYFYGAADPDSLGNKYVEFLDDLSGNPGYALANNKRYLLCVYNSSDSLRIGYDSRIDYFATVNNYLQPIAPVKTKANPGSAEWAPAGFGYDVTPAIAAQIDFPTSDNSISTATTAVPYPNPAVNMLSVPVRKGVTGNVTVEIFDLAGKLVISENKTIGEGPLKVNVASISNGAYVFNLTFADGSKDTFKVSVNR